MPNPLAFVGDRNLIMPRFRSKIARSNSLDTVEVLRPPSLDLHMPIAIVRVGQLGAWERAVEPLEHGTALGICLRQSIYGSRNEEPKGCTRESAEGATAQVVVLA